MSSSEEPYYEQSSEIINLISVLIKTTHIHDYDNIAVSNTIERLLLIMIPILENEKTITIEIVNDFFYFNQSRIKYVMSYLTNIDYLMDEIKKRNVGKIVIHHGVVAEDIKLFLKSFVEAGSKEEPFEVMVSFLKKRERIFIEELTSHTQSLNVDHRRLVKKTYFNAVSMTKGIMNKIKAGEEFSLKKAKRVIESTVDRLLEEESLLLGLTVLKDYDDYTYHHSVNVSILSMAIGLRLGMSKKAIAQLGLAALFHDLGKIHVPPEILNKPSSLSDQEMDVIKHHSLWGLKTMLKIKGLDHNSIRASIVAFEHHISYDTSGYPKLRYSIRQDLYSKIVAIADQYDAMTSARVYSRTPLAPDKALRIMIQKMSKDLDPYITKVFINMVGVYPIGSLVAFDTQELGIVLESNSNPLFNDRPKVRILMNKKGQRVDNTADLMEQDEWGIYKRTIVKTLDPNIYKINLTEYFL
jgi:HD-GYP domain-containing protein (c-di-GMP phosphodiesterase class II)